MKIRPIYLAGGIPAAIVIFLLLTMLFTPNDAVRGVLVRAAENAGYTLTFTGFGKAFPIGVKARTLDISSEKGSLITLRDARVRLSLLPLLTGKLQFAYSGGIGPTGKLEGDVTLGKAPGFRVEGKGVRLEDIPFFTTVAGAKVGGNCG